MAGCDERRAELSTLNYLIHVRTNLGATREGLRSPSLHPTHVHTVRLRHDKTETGQEVCGFVCSCGRICRITDKNGTVKGTSAIVEQVFLIPGGIGRVVVRFTAMSSLFFLWPPKTHFNLDPALLEDVTVGDGGGAVSLNGDPDCIWPIVGTREEEQGSERIVSEEEMTLGHSKN
jgi:hypothetical protein